MMIMMIIRGNDQGTGDDRHDDDEVKKNTPEIILGTKSLEIICMRAFSLDFLQPYICIGRRNTACITGTSLVGMPRYARDAMNLL